MGLFPLRHCLIKREPHWSPTRLPENKRQVAGWALPCCSLVPAPLPAPAAQLGLTTAHWCLSLPSPSVTAWERHGEQGESPFLVFFFGRAVPSTPHYTTNPAVKFCPTWRRLFSFSPGHFGGPGGSEQQRKARNRRQHQNHKNLHFSPKQTIFCRLSSAQNPLPCIWCRIQHPDSSTKRLDSMFVWWLHRAHGNVSEFLFSSYSKLYLLVSHQRAGWRSVSCIIIWKRTAK